MPCSFRACTYHRIGQTIRRLLHARGRPVCKCNTLSLLHLCGSTVLWAVQSASRELCSHGQVAHTAGIADPTKQNQTPAALLMRSICALCAKLISRSLKCTHEGQCAYQANLNSPSLKCTHAGHISNAARAAALQPHTPFEWQYAGISEATCVMSAQVVAVNIPTPDSGNRCS